MQTIQYRKTRIWEMKEDNYTKSLAKISGLCDIKYAKYSGKCYTQIHKTLHGDAILVSLSVRGTNLGQFPFEKRSFISGNDVITQLT